MTAAQTPRIDGPVVPVDIEIRAGRLTRTELAAVVVALRTLGDCDPPHTQPPAWRQAALVEQAGAAPPDSPAALRLS